MDTSSRAPKKRAENRKRPKPTACFALLPEQVERLRQMAEERQVSQSMLVRDALDHYFRQIIQEVVEQRSQAEAPPAAENPPIDMAGRFRVVKAEQASGD